jgi:homoaconitase/3-isopropylmalate dehydratase large subunit
MGRNVAQQLIESHLVSGEMRAGAEIALAVDQTLTQDATGTMVMLELEALGLDRVRTGDGHRAIRPPGAAAGSSAIGTADRDGNSWWPDSPG